MSTLFRRRALLLGFTALGLLTSGAQCPRGPQADMPVRGLTPVQTADFLAGRAVFEHEFSPDSGLGPSFNAVSCLECHEDPIAGGNGDEDETHAAIVTPAGCNLLVDRGGPVFQKHTTPLLQAATGLDSEPTPTDADPATRTSPDLFGFGLLDAVSDKTILAYADSADRNHDGISGRA